MVTEVKPMEVKKTQQIAASTPKDKEQAILFSAWKPKEFVGDIKEEIKKISWTSPEELKVYTQIVVGATFCCGIGIYILDLFIQSVLNGLAATIRLLAG